jgi:hypothetical protein
MEQLIDNVVSSSWLFIVVVFAAMMASGYFFFLQPLRRQWLNMTLGTILACIFIYTMIFATRGHFGYAVEFIGIYSNGMQICLEEEHEVGDGDGGSSTVHRIYVLEQQTGKRILRKIISNPNILNVTSGAYVVYEYDAVVKYDLFDGQEMKRWSKEEGFEKFPELTSGISALTVYHQEVNGQKKGFIAITAMNGHDYYFDTVTETLQAERPVDEIKDQYAFSISHLTGQIKQLVRNRPTERIYNKQLLEPEVLFYDETQNMVVLKHYSTLDKSNAVLTGLTYDLHERWNVEQASLGLKDDYEELPLFGSSLISKNDLIVTFGGTVVCFNLITGKERWRNRL